jgi:nucleoid-associated protein YgaU
MAAAKWGFGIGAVATLALSACAAHSSVPNPFAEWNGHLTLESHPNYSKSLLQRNGQPVVLLIGEVSDGRPDASSHKVGEIGSTVMFMASTNGTLVLDQNVSSVVFTALKSQLAADGFRTVSDPHEPHDFEVNSVAKNFQLNIVAQDDLNITVDMTLRDAKSGEVLWAGSVEEKSSRFAGVSGDTGNSILRYFNRGLSNWAVKASANVSDNLLKIYPQTIALVARKDLVVPPHIVGVRTVQEATPREAAKIPAATPSAAPAVAAVPAAPAAAPATPAVVAAAPVAAAAPPASPVAAPATASVVAAVPVAPTSTKGTFSLTTVPSKAKVYGDDVYYGTSPLKLELDPGVTVFHFKLDGYKTVTQKVSIRRGETTELEVKLDK